MKIMKNGSSNATNNSTLSLHIADYEFTIESKVTPKENAKTNASEQKCNLIQQWKSVTKAWFQKSQNVFEIPRQQEARDREPEILNFSSSQHLISPNEQFDSFNMPSFLQPSEPQRDLSQDSAIIDPQLSNSAISDPQLSNSAISDSQLSNSAISDSQLSNSAISDSQLSNSAISDSQLSNSAISDSQLSNSAISDPQLSTPVFKKARTGLTDDDKTRIMEKLSKNEYSLKGIQDEKDIMQFVTEGKIRKAALCTVCKALLSAKSGGSITYHRNQCTKMVGVIHRAPYPVNEEDRKAIVNKVLSCIVTNYLPAALFNNHVFLDLLQTVHNLGFKVGFDSGRNLNAKDEVIYGPASICKIMPHRTNIRRTLDRTVQEKSLNLVEFIQSNISDIGGALTCDMTSKVYHYVGYSFHFITRDWKLVWHVLPVGMKEFNQRPNATNILDDTVILLNEYSILLSELRFVTDEGSSMVAAYKDLNQIICVDHGLNTVVKRGLDPYKETRQMPIRLTPASKAAVEELNGLVKDVKSLVQYVKRRPNINTRLDLRLILDADTRWMSKLHMVKRVLNMSSQDTIKLREYLNIEDPSMLEKFDLIRHKSDKLQILVDVYQPFLEAMLAMEAENQPTLFLVPIYYSKLINHLNEAKVSSDTTKAGLAESVLKVMEYKKDVLLTDDHFMALMLNPKHNGLVEKLMTPEKVDALFKKISEEGGTINGEANPNAASDSTKFNSRKRQRHQTTIDNELDEYIEISIPTDCENFCLLSWWRENSIRFPRLSKLARKYHSIPASSASVERLFSVLNMLTPDERLSLTPAALSNMVKLRAIMRVFPLN
uniref:HAT C-terminal dimerisation domain-containing protein n=1 Tax=Panagrolaimus davidi TaxID=227884 RepID=A0A914PAG0_9BILA